MYKKVTCSEFVKILSKYKGKKCIIRASDKENIFLSMDKLIFNYEIIYELCDDDLMHINWNNVGGARIGKPIIIVLYNKLDFECFVYLNKSDIINNILFNDDGLNVSDNLRRFVEIKFRTNSVQSFNELNLLIWVDDDENTE